MTRGGILLLSSTALFAAVGLTPGRLAPRVECAAAPTKSYALYLPSSYTPDKEWPVLYVLDPMARGEVAARVFEKAAESEGYIVAASNDSRNGPMEPVRGAIEAMWNDTHERLRIDPKRVYAAGFSGGSRVALGWARSGQIAGVVACGAAFGEKTPANVRFAVFATAGVEDLNYDEMIAMSLDLQRAGVPNRFATFEGGHAWMPEPVASEALQFLSGKLPPQPAVETKETRKAAEEFRRLNADLARNDDEARKDLIRDLRKRSNASDDTPSRRVARRVLSGAYIGAIESSRSLMSDKRYRDAAVAWERATVIRPDSALAWFGLAVALGASGEDRRSLDALQSAAKAGFTQWDRADAEPLLAKVRENKRYRELAGR